MKTVSIVRSSRPAFLALLATLALVSQAPAGDVLNLDGNYNHTTINFTVGGVAKSESGGGAVGGTLDGHALPYMYCVEWQLSVLVPDLYANSVVTQDGTIHGHSLPVGTGATNPAEEIAWLVVNRSPLASPTDFNQQAGLQALIWQEVTPDFVLTSTNGQLVAAYEADVEALQKAEAQPGGLPDLRSQVLFISPSTDGDVNDHNQGQVAYIPGGFNSPSAVPEPSTYALLGVLGVAGSAVAWLRRERAAGPDRPR